MSYNPNDYQPGSGKIVKSDGTVVDEGDGYNIDGSQNVVLYGRRISYQRVMVGQTITASNSKTSVVNVGSGKGLNIVYSTSGNAQLLIYGADFNGNAIIGGNSLVSSASAGATNGSLIISEYGGAPYVTILLVDKSAATNTINYVDIWASQA